MKDGSIKRTIMKLVIITSDEFKKAYRDTKGWVDEAKYIYWKDFYNERDIPCVGVTLPPEPSLIFDKDIDCEMEMLADGTFEFKVYKYGW